MLVEKKADGKARDHNGCTALMFAVANGDAVTMKALLDAGANPEVSDYEGHKPMDYAEQFGHPELMALLEGDENWSSSDESTAGGEAKPGRHATYLMPVPEDEA